VVDETLLVADQQCVVNRVDWPPPSKVSGVRFGSELTSCKTKLLVAYATCDARPAAFHVLAGFDDESFVKFWKQPVASRLTTIPGELRSTSIVS
jgi:hypothetical protein